MPSGKLSEAITRVALEIGGPAALELPFIKRRLPAGAFGEDVALQAERAGIDFINVDAAHDAGDGIEIFVVINAVVLGVDPLALRMQVGLRSFAFDDGAELILAAVGVGDPEIIEREESGAQAEAGDQNRNGQAMGADAAGFERGNFVVFAEKREDHQDRCEHSDGREIVDEARGQEEMILTGWC